MTALGMAKKKASKDPGIPNLYPFKKQVVESLKRKKDQELQEKKLKRLEKKNKNQPVDIEAVEANANTFEQRVPVVEEP